MPAITSKFAPGDHVYIDGCTSMTGVITAVQWRHPEIINYEVSWVSQGQSMSPIIEGFRLTLANKQVTDVS